MGITGFTILAALVAPSAQAGSLSGNAGASSRFCDRTQELSAAEQARLLRFAGVLREELAGSMDARGEHDDAADAMANGGIALVSRSGLDLSRFGIRYSHAALAWRSDAGVWSARQLYYACDERRPRIFDQGLAGFAMGTDDPKLGYLSIVRLPPEAALALRPALLDRPRVQHLLAAQYSANAYAFSVRYQNCNQWVVEMLAAGWGDLADGDDLRERAQDWLRSARYAPPPVDVGSWWLMQAPHFMPLLHLDDHPDHDRDARQLVISLPTSVEQFVRLRFPASERVELCHDGRRVVVRHGWTAIADGCVAEPGDRVVSLVD